MAAKPKAKHFDGDPMKSTPWNSIAQEEGETKPATPLCLLCVGQTVKVQRGSLAGIRGTLLFVTPRQRWMVQLDDAPGVLIEIDATMLVACEGMTEEPDGDQDASPTAPFGGSSSGDLPVC